MRHGESSSNVARALAEAGGLAMIDIAHRDMDVPLSALGEHQAHALGRWFGKQPDTRRPSVVLSSPYRSLLQPFLEYLDHLLALGDNHMVTIVIPEFVTKHWWQHLLHNQTAFLIKGTLLFRKNVVVTDVPYHLR